MSQVKHTHTALIQDLSLCKSVGLGVAKSTMLLNGKPIKCGGNGNPDVWYIDRPLKIKVGDVLNGYKIVDIGEYKPQPTLRTLYLVKA